MANLKWLGATSSDSTNVNNWVDLSTGSAPSSIGSSDVLNFTEGSSSDCELNQTTLGIINADRLYVAAGRKLVFTQATLQVAHITLGHAQIIKFTQSSTTITFAGTHGTAAPYHDHPLIFNGDVTYDTGGNAKTTVTFVMKNGNSSAAHLTNGELPNVTLDGKFTFDAPHEDILSAYEPDAAFSESNCCKLTITAAATFDNNPLTHNDTQKHIRVTGNGSSSGQHFACAAAICDFSNAKLTIDAKNSQQMPCTNDVTNFGTSTDFIALLEDVVVGNFSGNGNKNIIPEGLTLECASLEIQSGSYLYGGGTNLQTGAKSHIHAIERPTIRGTWNFEETANGIYSSIGGVSSASIHTLKSDTVHILGKLTVDGLIDPTGLELTPVGSNPGGTAANTLWLNSGDSNKLYHGSSEVAGGGSGDIEGVTTASNSGLAGGATTGTPNLTLDINNLAAEDIASGDMIAFNDAGDNGIHKESIDDIATLFAGTGLAASSAVLSVDLNEVGAITPAIDDNIILTDTNAANATKKAAVGDVVVAGLAGAPISTLTNDAGYLTAANTPTAMFAKFRENNSSHNGDDVSAGSTGAIITGSDTWVTETGNAALLASLNQTGGHAQDGVMTFTAATAGTYQINIQIQYGAGSSSGLSETSGATYKLQLLPYHLAAASAGSFGVGGGNLLAYSRKIVTQYWKDQCQQISFMATFADGDLFWVQSKIVASSGSGNYRIKGSGASGSSTVFLDMIRINPPLA